VRVSERDRRCQEPALLNCLEARHLTVPVQTMKAREHRFLPGVPVVEESR
jgi:hypothetical protein